MTTFAETVVLYADGQPNVVQPPESLMLNGFIPKTKGANGQPIVANYLNWIFREIFRKVNQSKLMDGAGINAVPGNTGFITLYAMVKNEPTKFLHAMGYKDGGGVPQIKVLNSNTLTLGTVTPTDIPINGAPSGTIALKITFSEPQ